MKKLVSVHAVKCSVLWSAVIFALCATPGQYIPSSAWLDLLSVDKLVHAVMFFVLSMLWFTAAIRRRVYRMIPVVVLACVAYGILLEIMQATCFSHRSADWKDVIANSAGCLAALFFLKKLKDVFAAKDLT